MSFLKIKNRIQNLIKNVRGAILLEFAICMPVLILMLFGLHDIFRMARMQDRTNLVAHEIVSMVQNISQGRNDKKITLTDLEYICRFASSSIYPGVTAYATAARRHTYVHFPYIIFYYIKGGNDGTATCHWRVQVHTGYPVTNAYSRATKIKSGSEWSSVSYGADKLPSAIYPSLVIGAGETKVIVEAFIAFQSGKDGYSNKTVNSAKQAFGTYILTPPAIVAGHFHSVAIFTPKRGLFDEVGPI